MRVRLSDPRFTDDLVRFFAGTDCLAVKRGRDVVDVVPINPVSERYDRAKVAGYVSEWSASRPDAGAELID